jgi:hypothetical protein
MSRTPIFLVLILSAAVPAFAQSTGNLPLVGVLRINTPDNVEPFPTIFRKALANEPRSRPPMIAVRYSYAMTQASGLWPNDVPLQRHR